jgi:hypothetical protein
LGAGFGVQLQEHPEAERGSSGSGQSVLKPVLPGDASWASNAWEQSHVTRGMGDLWANLSREWMPPLMRDLRALDLHVSTRYALGHTASSQVAARTVVIAVDGSGSCSGTNAPAWSFNAVACNRDGTTSFLGIAGGRVQLDKDQGDFIGATRGSYGSAAMSALVWALVWAMQQQLTYHVEIQFGTMHSAMTIQALWRTRSHDPLVKFAMLLHDMAACLLHIEWTHTPQKRRPSME